MDDATLLERLRNGDADAFEWLVRAHHEPMKRLAATMVGTGQAEEVVQEAWLAAMRNLAGFEQRCSLKTWLYTIVSNEARSRLRRARREVSLDDATTDGEAFAAEKFIADGHWARAPTPWHTDSPEALLGEEDFRRCLEKTLEKLPEAQRAALLLRDQDELPLEEICNILGIAASNARVLVHRARARVYAMIEHYEETGTC